MRGTRAGGERQQQTAREATGAEVHSEVSNSRFLKSSPAHSHLPIATPGSSSCLNARNMVQRSGNMPRKDPRTRAAGCGGDPGKRSHTHSAAAAECFRDYMRRFSDREEKSGQQGRRTSQFAAAVPLKVLPPLCPWRLNAGSRNAIPPLSAPKPRINSGLARNFSEPPCSCLASLSST